MGTVRIYHNPRCSKSRQTLELLRDQGVEPEIREYLKEPPSKSEVKELLQMLQLEPRDIMRKKEPEYKAHNVDNAKLSKDELIAAIIEYPKLLERPIVVNENKAIIGRPPENALKIL